MSQLKFSLLTILLLTISIVTSDEEVENNFIQFDEPEDSDLNMTEIESTDLDQNVTEEESSIDEVEDAIIHKCLGSLENSTFIYLQESLQLPYDDVKKLDHFKYLFNVDILFNFTLVEREPICGEEGHFQLNISTAEYDPKQSPSFNFTPDGYLGYYKSTGVRKREELYFHPNNYCLLDIDEDIITLKVCKSRCYIEKSEKGSTLCVPKCCNLGEVMASTSDNTKLCTGALRSDWVPQIYSNLTATSPEPEVYPNFQYNFYPEHWKCPSENLAYSHHNQAHEDYRILANGSIYARGSVLSGNKWIRIGSEEDENELHSQFCIDGLWTKNIYYIPESSKNVISVCFPTNVTDIRWYIRLVAGISFFSSLVYLLIIFVYGALAFDRTQNAYGWSILCFALVNFFLSIILAGSYGAVGFLSNPQKILHDELRHLCTTLGIAHHFLIICCFSWTSVISFDVWSKIRSITSKSAGSKGKKKFLCYCSFGFGIPALVVTVAILMEFVVETNDSLTRPEYTEVTETCIISHKDGFTYYISCVITPLFLVNGFLAILTLKFILDSKKNVKNLKDSATSSKFNKGWLAIKLFVLMGLFLIFELILAYLDPSSHPQKFIYVEFYRILNALGSLWIFVWNFKTRTQLGQKFPFLKNSPLIPQLPPTVTFNISKDTPFKLSRSISMK